MHSLLPIMLYSVRTKKKKKMKHRFVVIMMRRCAKAVGIILVHVYSHSLFLLWYICIPKGKGLSTYRYLALLV